MGENNKLGCNLISIENMENIGCGERIPDREPKTISVIFKDIESAQRVKDLFLKNYQTVIHLEDDKIKAMTLSKEFKEGSHKVYINL